MCCAIGPLLRSYVFLSSIFFNDTATTEIYTLSLHDALPIYVDRDYIMSPEQGVEYGMIHVDRKSTRLNSSHLVISYAVFCLKKKKPEKARIDTSPTGQYRNWRRPGGPCT